MVGWEKSRAVSHEVNITQGWDADSGCTSLRQISMLPPKNPQLCTTAGSGHRSASPGNIWNSKVFPSSLDNKASQLGPWVQCTKAAFPSFQCQEPSHQQGRHAWSQAGYQGSPAPRGPRIRGARAPAISPAPGFFPTRRDSQHTPARPGAHTPAQHKEHCPVAGPRSPGDPETLGSAPRAREQSPNVLFMMPELGRGPYKLQPSSALWETLLGAERYSQRSSQRPAQAPYLRRRLAGLRTRSLAAPAPPGVGPAPRP